MKILIAQSTQRDYPIYIGRGLLAEAGRLVQQNTTSRHLVIVTDETVAPLYLKPTRRALASIGEVGEIVIPAGEKHKTLETFELICTELLKQQVRRDALLVVLGGGVVGDVAGFAAATYQRGINFVQIPTTLLAQVDSSVGGKTAVNHALGKNMIGAFYQPHCVISDLDTLSTLPSRHFIAGLAEVVKYGLILDAEFFTWLEENAEALLAQQEAPLVYAVERSCTIKAEIVAADEHEQSGHRARLNLGHTFAHAIEANLGYGEWLHGEAVACGLILAARLSAELGMLDHDSVERITALISRLGLPTKKPKQLGTQAMMASMALDKKHSTGYQRYILLRTIGSAWAIDQVDASAVKAVLD